MKLFGKKGNEIWYKGALIDIMNKEKSREEVSSTVISIMWHTGVPQGSNHNHKATAYINGTSPHCKVWILLSKRYYRINTINWDAFHDGYTVMKYIFEVEKPFCICVSWSPLDNMLQLGT